MGHPKINKLNKPVLDFPSSFIYRTPSLDAVPGGGGEGGALIGRGVCEISYVSSLECSFELFDL